MTQKNIANHIFKANYPKHKEISFVNTKISGDTMLFIDPVLIETGVSDFCLKAKVVLQDFFDQFYKAYYITNNSAEKRRLLSHASEVNDSHLGYAQRYGHGNTEDGLIEIFKGIEDYIKNINITKIFELVLYVPGFAEDGMSDLLTNILYQELSEFTLKECKKYNIPVKESPNERFYWDAKTHDWKKYQGKSLIVNNEIFLLIPKEIVQQRYRFTCDNFLRSVIVENICKDAATYDEKTKKIIRPPKDAVRERLIKENGTILNTIKRFAQNDSNLLKEYQEIVAQKYKTLILSDKELDSIIYKGQEDKNIC